MSSQTEMPTKIVLKLDEGQLTIPVEYREKLGIEPGSMVQVILDQSELRIKPVGIFEIPTSSPAHRELYDYVAPARAEAIEKGYTEEEINEAIDAAVAAVRAERGS